MLERHQKVVPASTLKPAKTLPRWVRILRAGPIRVRRAFLTSLDHAYVAVQVTLKMMGMVMPYEHIPETDVDGERFANWERREQLIQLPALRVPLPPDATLRVTFESILSRGGIWITTSSPDELCNFVREKLGNDWKPISKRVRAHMMLRHEETGAEVAVVSRTGGSATLTIRQQPPRFNQVYLHLQPVEEALLPPRDGALPKPPVDDDP